MVPQGAGAVPRGTHNGQMRDPLHVGDKAIIISGPFEGKAGTIASIEGDLATLAVDVFARNTPVQVPLADLAAAAGPG
jgi:transcription antitermination factor NusG